MLLNCIYLLHYFGKGVTILCHAFYTDATNTSKTWKLLAVLPSPYINKKKIELFICFNLYQKLDQLRSIWASLNSRNEKKNALFVGVQQNYFHFSQKSIRLSLWTQFDPFWCWYQILEWNLSLNYTFKKKN